MPIRRPQLVGPTERPDAADPHPNPIRRFREELRLTREAFAEKIGEKVDSLRMWESENRGRSGRPTRPKGETAIKIVELARQNFYPLTLDQIFTVDPPKKASVTNKKTKKAKAKRK